MNETDRAITAALDAARSERAALRVEIAEKQARIEFLTRIIRDGSPALTEAKDALRKEEAGNPPVATASPLAIAAGSAAELDPAGQPAGIAKALTDAQTIVQIIEGRGWTAEEAAGLIGVSVNAVNSWFIKATADSAGIRDRRGREPRLDAVRMAAYVQDLSKDVVQALPPRRYGRGRGYMKPGGLSHMVLRHISAVGSAPWSDCVDAVSPRVPHPDGVSAMKLAGFISEIGRCVYQITPLGQAKLRALDDADADRRARA